ncbi:DoxX family protein [Aquilutibacter rugosus]|uniref:DoxX family protein n=1 Tax=Aquilutibacter rugosus TaxID=3115820 RepID=UPI003877D97A
MNNALNLAGRILLSLIFILSGWSKISGYEATQGYMTSMGVPGQLLPLVIILELLGGLAIAFGLFTRWTALALAGFSVVSAVIFHSNLGDQAQFINFFKNLAMAGGFLILAANGPGALSLDSWLAGRRTKA